MTDLLALWFVFGTIIGLCCIGAFFVFVYILIKDGIIDGLFDKNDYISCTSVILLIPFITFMLMLPLITLSLGEQIVTKTNTVEVKFNEELNRHDIWEKTNDGYKIHSFEQTFGKIYDDEQIENVSTSKRFWFLTVPEKTEFTIVEGEVL